MPPPPRRPPSSSFHTVWAELVSRTKPMAVSGHRADTSWCFHSTWESDSGVIGHGMAQMLMGKNDLVPFIDRVKDVHFLLDQLESLNAGKVDGADYLPFRGHLDLTKIGMAGHSFGALTTQAIIGEKYSLDADGKMIDPRIKAAIVMSGSGSRERDQDQAFGSIHIPVFYLTGTADKIGIQTAADRRVPFDHSSFPETFLVTLDGATHMTFVPRERVVRDAEAETYQSLIRQSTTAFWDSFLKGDAKAKMWWTTELATLIGKAGVFEKK